MLKKSITYQDFNGNEVVEDFFFHLSKAELVELEMSHKGGLAESLQKIIADEDGKQIIAEFKNIILSAYGKRSEDGKRFVKNTQLREEFESSEAYSALFMELVTNADAAVEFINGIVPGDLEAQAAKITKADLAVIKDEEPPQDTNANAEVISREEFAKMSVEDMRAASKRIAAGEAVLK